MKRNYWFLIGIFGLVGVAGGAYILAKAMMDSVYAFRSPLSRSAPAPAPAPANRSPVTGKAVIVLIDALRLDTSLKAEVMPVLNGLRVRGASATMHSQPPSFSEPGYTTILTGAWPEINDSPPVNLEYAEIPTFTQDDLFSAAHRAGLRTAISGYYWFEKLVPQASVDASFYTAGEDAAADQEVLAAALPWLRQDFQLVLIHLDQVDYAGHNEGGPRDPSWDLAAARADALLGAVVAALDLEFDTLLVVSDHGQIGRGGHGGPERAALTEPFVLCGAGVRPGAYPDVHMVDIAPTLAALLGTSIPATNQGHVLGAMLALTPSRLDSYDRALAAQQATLATAYEAAIGEPVAVTAGAADVVDATQAAMARARIARLTRERIPRLVLALVLALLPAGLMIARRGRKWLWILGAGLLYLLLFNLGYAVLDARTYSLSSVDSQEWMLEFMAPTAAFSLVAGWLLVAAGTGALGRKRPDAGPRKAAALTLCYVWFTLYLLGLPVLASFAVNGLLTTWALPEFVTSYLSLISLIQAVVAAASGLLLTGLAAGIASLVER